jgi:hypothetical protein
VVCVSVLTPDFVVSNKKEFMGVRIVYKKWQWAVEIQVDNEKNNLQHTSIVP